MRISRWKLTLGITLIAICCGLSHPSWSQTRGVCTLDVDIENQPCPGGELVEPHFIINNRCNCAVALKITDDEGKTHSVNRGANLVGKLQGYISTCRRKPLS